MFYSKLIEYNDFWLLEKAKLMNQKYELYGLEFYNVLLPGNDYHKKVVLVKTNMENIYLQLTEHHTCLCDDDVREEYDIVKMVHYYNHYIIKLYASFDIEHIKEVCDCTDIKQGKKLLKDYKNSGILLYRATVDKNGNPVGTCNIDLMGAYMLPDTNQCVYVINGNTYDESDYTFVYDHNLLLLFMTDTQVQWHGDSDYEQRGVHHTYIVSLSQDEYIDIRDFINQDFGKIINFNDNINDVLQIIPKPDTIDDGSILNVHMGGKSTKVYKGFTFPRYFGLLNQDYIVIVYYNEQTRQFITVSKMKTEYVNISEMFQMPNMINLGRGNLCNDWMFIDYDGFILDKTSE